MQIQRPDKTRIKVAVHLPLQMSRTIAHLPHPYPNLRHKGRSLGVAVAVVLQQPLPPAVLRLVEHCLVRLQQTSFTFFTLFFLDFKRCNKSLFLLLKRFFIWTYEHTVVEESVKYVFLFLYENKQNVLVRTTVQYSCRLYCFEFFF